MFRTSWPSTAAGSASAAGRPTDDVHSTWNKASLPPPPPGAANTSDATGRNTNDRADTTKPPPPSTATT
ncbi:hypothetical protein, partial [Streptosporangium sp. NPDC049304]|uniref:hypothetical protein n=1 Tax=Streptosporangium sp. NPDC049304 TaxID=3154830 RepID=UPI00342EB4CC